MTPAQAAWLRRLRDEGPQHTGPMSLRPGEVEGLLFAGMIRFTGQRRRPKKTITTAGLAALAAYEEKAK